MRVLCNPKASLPKGMGTSAGAATPKQFLRRTPRSHIIDLRIVPHFRFQLLRTGVDLSSLSICQLFSGNNIRPWENITIPLAYIWFYIFELIKSGSPLWRNACNLQRAIQRQIANRVLRIPFSIPQWSNTCYQRQYRG